MKCSLPVDWEAIQSLGMNPLREETKHRDYLGLAPYMEFAWDFMIPRLTTIRSVLPGKVYWVDTLSDTEPTAHEMQVLRDTFHKGWDDYAIDLRRKLYAKNNRVVIDHGGIFSIYSHVAYKGDLVETGQEVKENQPVALSGNVGVSTDPHLHFEMFIPRKDLSVIVAVDGRDRDRDRRTSVPTEFYSGKDRLFTNKSV